MKITKRMVISITFINGETDRVPRLWKEIKEKHPAIKQKEVYLKGLETLVKE